MFVFLRKIKHYLFYLFSHLFVNRKTAIRKKRPNLLNRETRRSCRFCSVLDKEEVPLFNQILIFNLTIFHHLYVSSCD